MSRGTGKNSITMPAAVNNAANHIARMAWFSMGIMSSVLLTETCSGPVSLNARVKKLTMFALKERKKYAANANVAARDKPSLTERVSTWGGPDEDLAGDTGPSPLLELFD